MLSGLAGVADPARAAGGSGDSGRGITRGSNQARRSASGLIKREVASESQGIRRLRWACIDWGFQRRA